MASAGEKGTVVPQVRQVTVSLTPRTRFPVPKSDGYSVYSALLSVLSDVSEEIGSSVHDSPLGSLHNSGLLGPRGSSDRPHHKLLLPDETYELSLGIVHPEDGEVFQALVNALVLQNETVELSHGELEVREFESSNATHEELLAEASQYDDPTVEMTFQTATCIEEADGVTTMFPTRGAVFNSLLGKWNRSVPEELELDLTREEVDASVIEKPNDRSYQTHSVLVNRVKNDNGENRNIFRQGFTGECAYAFKGASESVENAVTALALFGEYSGVGSAVARGCGQVSTEVKD
ncbi:CRISPR-associated endoribonuclease Cas6 [Natronomonas pharaonis DSM 2160]|uniref:CRISPR-associated endoribonuclease Cas6 n=1 Tax=Natronomonas pharaonis (strain ATCC 35678 / DSM 2160 / CIP 103997 / JCM 8858 / NBRC 14720 / NCIMB 2260 / Gabara) TaxID=348780 RepID=A0A1U7EX80_NATPD|nr:CRISPR system precrRNA processing endoribonuclease RAMP protein Cas6 [Natronomonas pharaonis]CAI49722.1 CRISPR-associated endoribonuclease Cas6 [Natronomonas pharaonis DSM 2160]